jgi:signal transduction histidine kinase
VRGCSRPWEPWELEAARGLRGAVVGIILRKAAEIEALNASLRAALRGRDDFLSVASHELRTPITTLGLQLASIRKACSQEGPPGGKLGGKLDMADRQVERLTRLVGELLDVSLMTAGKLPLQIGDADLWEITRAVVERFQDAASASGTLITLYAVGPVPGRWDELRLDQVVTNLLSNALKYGPGAPIEVSVERTAGGAVLRVVDHGCGVPPDALERIFERFERAALPGPAGSLGLGLWIVRQIVERHGGSVRLDSRAGQGSTVTVTLPLEAPPS